MDDIGVLSTTGLMGVKQDVLSRSRGSRAHQRHGKLCNVVITV